MRTKKQLIIDNFKSFKDCDKFYNFLPCKTLKNSVGVVEATFPTSSTNLKEASLNLADAGITEVGGLSYFKQYFPDENLSIHRLVVYSADKKVYINQMFDEDFDLYWLYEMQFDSAPISLAFKQNDSDSIILAGSDKMMVWKTDFSPYIIENAPIITSMCVNDNALFCTIKEPAFKIWYNTALNAEKVGSEDSKSGYISLVDELGYARKVIAFDENVYAFRDYGISKISINKSEISVNQVYQFNTKIYANTISACGNKIIFMTKEGMYSFNGVKVMKLDIDFSSYKFENYESAVASSLSDKYYLALRLNFNDNSKIECESGNFINNAMIIVNILDNSFEIVRGVDIKSFLPLKTELVEKMLVTFNSVYKDKIGQIEDSSKCFNNNLTKSYQTKSIVQSETNKLFTKLIVKSQINVVIKLKYDNNEINLTTYKTGINEFNFKICCKDIKFEIISELNHVEIEKMLLEYYEY